MPEGVPHTTERAARRVVLRARGTLHAASGVWAANGRDGGPRLAVASPMVNRRASVQSRYPEQIEFRMPGRDPPLKYHPARACHREQTAIPGWCCGVAGQRAVGAVVMDELLGHQRVQSSLRHPAPSSASAFSSQNRMSISRYIVVAVVRCSCAWSRFPVRR